MSRMTFAFSAGLVFLLTGCASTKPISELREGVRTSAFIQHGVEPHEYFLGVVDGKSFWAHGAQNVNVSVPGISATTAAAATAVVNTGAALAREEVRREADIVPEMFRAMLNNRPIASDLTRAVMPAIAEAWGVPYQPDEVRIIPAQTILASEEGHFNWADPNTDLVIVFSVSRLGLTEKPSVGGLFAAIATVGFNEKDVAPEIWNFVMVFKRDPADRKLKRVWHGQCLGPVLSMPITRKFSDLRANPDRGREMFDAAVNVTVENCRQVFARKG